MLFSFNQISFEVLLDVFDNEKVTKNIYIKKLKNETKENLNNSDFTFNISCIISTK